MLVDIRLVNIYIYIYIYISFYLIYNCVGLVSLFNSISPFVGYLMPKLFSQKNCSGTI